MWMQTRSCTQIALCVGCVNLLDPPIFRLWD